MTVKKQEDLLNDSFLTWLCFTSIWKNLEKLLDYIL